MCRILRSPRVAATFLSSTHVHSTLEMLLDIMLRTGWSHGSFRRPCGMCALLRCFDSGAPTEVDVVDTCLQLIQACVRSGRLDRMERCLRGRLMEHEAAEIPMMCFIGALRKPQDCKWLQGRLSSHPYPPVVRGVIVSLYNSEQLGLSECVDDLLYCATEGCFRVDVGNMHLHLSRHSPEIATALGRALLAASSPQAAAGRALHVIRQHALKWSSLWRSREERIRWLGEGFYMVVCVVFKGLIGFVPPEAVLETVLLLNVFRQDTADSEALVSTALSKVDPGELARLILPLREGDELVTGLSWLGQKGSEVCNRLCLPLLYRGLLTSVAAATALMAVTAGGLPYRDRLEFASRALDVHRPEQCGPLSLAICRLMEAADTDADLAGRMLSSARDATLQCADAHTAASLYEVFLRAGRRWAPLAVKLLFVPTKFDAEEIFRRVVTSEYDLVSKSTMFHQWIQLVHPSSLLTSSL
ncbi:Delta 8 Fatty Acid Desaturase [Perkinsus olseni]|uniref:Delta 8 Fatty Acid Desaturase n=1 Tax=Perkinsus olseni TaxID=32597 RepID=A0A7J6LQN1_PEROL|nr:Delta 8 Fatty Acid Desaturase [Perkinsus olseni]